MSRRRRLGLLVVLLSVPMAMLGCETVAPVAAGCGVGQADAGGPVGDVVLNPNRTDSTGELPAKANSAGSCTDAGTAVTSGNAVVLRGLKLQSTDVILDGCTSLAAPPCAGDCALCTAGAMQLHNGAGCGGASCFELRTEAGINGAVVMKEDTSASARVVWIVGKTTQNAVQVWAYQHDALPSLTAGCPKWTPATKVTYTHWRGKQKKGNVTVDAPGEGKWADLGLTDVADGDAFELTNPVSHPCGFVAVDALALMAQP